MKWWSSTRIHWILWGTSIVERVVTIIQKYVITGHYR